MSKALVEKILANRKRRQMRTLMAAPVRRASKAKHPISDGKRLQFDRTVTVNWIPNDEHAAWATNYLARKAAHAKAVAEAEARFREVVAKAPKSFPDFSRVRVERPAEAIEVVEVDGQWISLEAEPHDEPWSGEFCSHHVERSINGSANCGRC